MRSILIALITLATLPAMAQPYKIENSEVKLEQAIAFKAGSDQLEASSKAALEAVQQLLKDKSYISTLRVECHSDNTGIEKNNQALTEKRALAVCRELVKMGVDCKRLLAVGFGSTKPVADNATSEGKAQNRRTTFIIAGLRGRAIGGMPLDGGGKLAGEICQ
jgi:OmpA-OmpF porin, OOP family